MANINQPAFPLASGPQDLLADPMVNEGITLHAYFAARALTGIAAREKSYTRSPVAIADEALEYADAMIAAYDRRGLPAVF